MDCIRCIGLLLMTISQITAEWNFNSYNSKLGESHQSCPLWRISDGAGNCTCGNSLNGYITCNDDGTVTTLTNRGLCLTLMDNVTAVVSSCVYTLNNLLENSLNMNSIRTQIQSFDPVNEICQLYHRKGLLCGKCIDGYGLPMFSFNPRCVPCRDNHWNWLKYAAIAFIPLTFYLLIIIAFQVSITSGPIIAYITVSQMISNKDLLVIYTQIAPKVHSKYISVVLSLYSVSHLEIWRNHAFFCFHHSTPTLFIISLEYLVAIYPMAITLLISMLIKLQDRYWHFRYLYSPVNFCLHKIRKKWKIKHSLIKSFATLLLLSYSKILSVSFRILTPVTYTFANNSLSSIFVYHSPDLPYLCKKHVPYFVLGILVALVFNIFPIVILCLYPWACYQKFLDRIKLRSQTLNTFMDAFQGSYKHKPKYSRLFIAIFLLVQVLNAASLSSMYLTDYFQYMSFVLFILIVLLMLCQPFKDHHNNAVSIILFGVIMMWYISMNFTLQEAVLTHIVWKRATYYFTLISIMVPPLYGLFLIFNTVVLSTLKANLAKLLKKMRKVNNHGYVEIEESLPYRLQETF